MTAVTPQDVSSSPMVSTIYTKGSQIFFFHLISLLNSRFIPNSLLGPVKYTRGIRKPERDFITSLSPLEVFLFVCFLECERWKGSHWPSGSSSVFIDEGTLSPKRGSDLPKVTFRMKRQSSMCCPQCHSCLFKSWESSAQLKHNLYVMSLTSSPLCLKSFSGFLLLQESRTMLVFKLHSLLSHHLLSHPTLTITALFSVNCIYVTCSWDIHLRKLVLSIKDFLSGQASQ